MISSNLAESDAILSGTFFSSKATSENYNIASIYKIKTRLKKLMSNLQCFRAKDTRLWLNN
jgi:hypothetical protein